MNIFRIADKSSLYRATEIQRLFSRAGARYKNESPYRNTQRNNGGAATKRLKPKIELVDLYEKRQELTQMHRLTYKPIQTFRLPIGGLSLKEVRNLLNMGEGKQDEYRALQLSFEIDGNTLSVQKNEDRLVFGASQNLLKAAVQMAMLATAFSQKTKHFDFNLYEYTRGGAFSIHNDHGEVGMVVDVSNALASNGELINSRTGFYIEVPIGRDIYLIKVAQRHPGESAIFPQTKKYSISAYKSYLRADTEILKRERGWGFNDPVDDQIERKTVLDFINNNPELKVRCLHNADGDARVVMLLIAK